MTVDKVIRKSFMICGKIARHCKLYSDGEFVKECCGAVF